MPRPCLRGSGRAEPRPKEKAEANQARNVQVDINSTRATVHAGTALKNTSASVILQARPKKHGACQLCDSV